MREIPGPQQVYRHFKGGIYQVLSLAEHTESGEKLVIYQAMYGDFKVYARPLAMFMEKVDKAGYPEEAQEYRFERMEMRKEPDEPDEPQIPGIDPLVIRFLDADSYSEKLEILTALHARITTMAISIDVEVEEGEIEDRYEELRRCLLLYDKFECTRLR